ncbi:unnamed protein product [Allacma fusca]|uniref:Uncharacterized protein n=1 Tax=Allacma fusca TaxID=39272 RepID=A0A8J2LBB7_9HEXA|nr:unnamed protein product [Allacma fusca]
MEERKKERQDFELSFSSSQSLKPAHRDSFPWNKKSLSLCNLMPDPIGTSTFYSSSRISGLLASTLHSNLKLRVFYG